MGFRPDLSDAGPPEAPNRIKHRQHIGETVYAPNGTESRILIRDTWNTEIVSALKPQPNDITVYKHRFSGFYQTDLDAILRQLNVKYLVIIGCTTSVCVESTIRDAMFRDYSCLLLADCAAEPVGSNLAQPSEISTERSASVELFKVLSPLGRKTRLPEKGDFPNKIGQNEKSHVPDTFQLTAFFPFSAFLASRKINKLCVFNNHEYSDSPRLHHFRQRKWCPELVEGHTSIFRPCSTATCCCVQTAPITLASARIRRNGQKAPRGVQTQV